MHGYFVQLICEVLSKKNLGRLSEPHITHFTETQIPASCPSGLWHLSDKDVLICESEKAGILYNHPSTPIYKPI